MCETGAVVRLLCKGAVVGIAVLLSITYFVMIRPLPRDKARNMDAIVVLAGERSRLATGVQLADRGVAGVLIISNGNAKGWKEANTICASKRRYQVICPQPSSDDTEGEAHTISRIARVRGWNRLVLVSSNYHLRRARTLFHRCLKGELRVYASEPDRTSVGEWVGALLEWPKLMYATVDRDC